MIIHTQLWSLILNTIRRIIAYKFHITVNVKAALRTRLLEAFTSRRSAAFRCRSSAYFNKFACCSSEYTFIKCFKGLSSYYKGSNMVSKQFSRVSGLVLVVFCLSLATVDVNSLSGRSFLDFLCLRVSFIRILYIKRERIHFGELSTSFFCICFRKKSVLKQNRNFPIRNRPQLIKVFVKIQTAIKNIHYHLII